MTSKTISETKFKEHVMDDLEREFGLDCRTLKTQELARKGVLDLMLGLRGWHIEIELKKRGEEPTPLQWVNINRAIRAGNIAFYTDQDMWPAHLAMLKVRCARAH